jgi:hypothetical protein
MLIMLHSQRLHSLASLTVESSQTTQYQDNSHYWLQASLNSEGEMPPQNFN